MTCEERDQDILLLAHRELSPVRSLLTRLHLWRCPRCRNQHALLTGVSFALADALRTPDLPRWSPAGARPPWATPGARLLLVSLAVLLVVLSLFLVGSLTGKQSPSGANVRRGITNPPDGGCTPGLPNDHCR